LASDSAGDLDMEMNLSVKIRKDIFSKPNCEIKEKDCSLDGRMLRIRAATIDFKRLGPNA
jgi:hypothetical protein